MSKKILYPDKLHILTEKYSNTEAAILAAELGISKSSLFQAASKLGLKYSKELRYKNVNSSYDISNIEKIEDKYIAYTLGFIWADGHLAKPSLTRNNFTISLKIAKEDFDLVKDYFLRFAPGKIYFYNPKHSRNRKTTGQINFNNKKLWTFLKDNDYSIKSGASADKILARIPDHLKHYWFLGYFDGDGSINKTYGQVSISSCFSQDWQFVINLCKSINIFKYRIYKSNRKSSKCSSFHLSKNESRVFLEYIYQDQEMLGLPRKYDKYLNIFK